MAESRPLTKEEMDEWARTHRSTSEVAFERVGGAMAGSLPFDQVGEKGQVIQAGVTGAERTRRLAEIDRTMATIVREDLRRSNPVTGLDPSPTVTPVGAVPTRGPANTSGWREAAPLSVPGGATAQAVIGAMCNVSLPHGTPVEKKEK